MRFSIKEYNLNEDGDTYETVNVPEMITDFTLYLCNTENQN
jgi:hypothetical protein